MSQKTLVIAEAGVNHNGSLEIAKRLVDSASKAGADAVKFQTFNAEKLASNFAKKASYQTKTSARSETQLEMLKKLELSKENHIRLAKHCERRGIVFLSSPFDEESVDFLDSLGVILFKIPSGEITNHQLLQKIAKKKKPILLSTGMSTLGEVEEAIHTLTSAGNRLLTLLHCVTEYPAPYDQINLRAMVTLSNAFGLPVGYSDHTPGYEISLAAVALGAVTIEKHFTLDRSMKGPDHRSSMEPSDLRRLIEAVRNVEEALGDGRKRPAACELTNISSIRKSVVAAATIQANEGLTKKNTTIKRPGYGVPPKQWELLIGRKAIRRIERDEVITWEKVC